jgi:hypothetical protein
MDGFTAGSRLAYNLQVKLIFYQGDQSLAHYKVVVGDNQSNGHG